MRWCLISPSIAPPPSSSLSYGFGRRRFSSAITSFRIYATADGVEAPEEPKEEHRLESESPSPSPSSSSSPSALGKDLKKVVNKTAATFAPRASTASKNPAVPGTTLYKVFEVQAYASMLVGGILSFNLLFPSDEPDIWRLMGMWSIWMFSKIQPFFFPGSAQLIFLLPFHSPNSAIPSLRARDCPSKEKEALNYLFLIVPLLNVAIPFFWKSFALVWSADTLAFFAMYAWKVCFGHAHAHYWARRFFAMYASHFCFSFHYSLDGWKKQSRDTREELKENGDSLSYLPLFQLAVGVGE